MSGQVASGVAKLEMVWLGMAPLGGVADLVERSMELGGLRQRTAVAATDHLDRMVDQTGPVAAPDEAHSGTRLGSGKLVGECSERPPVGDQGLPYHVPMVRDRDDGRRPASFRPDAGHRVVVNFLDEAYRHDGAAADPIHGLLDPPHSVHR